MTESLEQYYSVQRVAEMFEVRPATVREWIEKGHLVGIRLPTGRYRISEKAIREFATKKYGSESA